MCANLSVQHEVLEDIVAGKLRAGRDGVVHLPPQPLDFVDPRTVGGLEQERELAVLSLVRLNLCITLLHCVAQRPRVQDLCTLGAQPMSSRGRPRKFGPRITVSVTSQDYDVLAALADQDEVSVSWVVRRAIDDYLAENRERAEPQLPLRVLQAREREAGL